MIAATFPELREVLCLGAHADDIEIGCGGTLLKLMREYPGLRVHWVVFSADDTRAVEARNSFERFVQDADGASFTQHRFRDSFFPYDAEKIKGVFHSMADQFSPDLILTHRRDDAHQDHRVLAELTWCAFRDHAVLEYEIPKYEGDLGNPNLFVQLSDEDVHRKIDHLMAAFPSQSDKPWYTEDTFRALLRLRGLECHATSRYAEGFYARKLVM
ncbi:MAG: PIG-L deacetylase family protein [Planctomycetota bacterium]